MIIGVLKIIGVCESYHNDTIAYQGDTHGTVDKTDKSLILSQNHYFVVMAQPLSLGE